MKKFILFFATLFISVISFAQSNSEHLTFKGVPIDGTLSEYVAKMKSAGFKSCTVGVSTLKAVNVVSKLGLFSQRVRIGVLLKETMNI